MAQNPKQQQQKAQKQQKQYRIIYQWLRIARKPHYTLAQDLQLLMQLIQISLTKVQLQMLIKMIDPTNLKKKLQEQDLIHCFIVPEDKKKPKEKQIQNAFKHIAEGEDTIQFDKLMECLEQQGMDTVSAQLVLKQLGDFETADNKFDYRKFANWYLQK